MKRKWIVCSALFILAVLILGGCGSDSDQQEDGDELKPIEITYLESIDDLGEMSEGFGLWYDTVSKPNSWPAFYQLDESFAEEGMTAYLFCHVSEAETPIAAEYVIPEEGNTYLQITTGWGTSNEDVEPREVLAILQVDSRGTDVQQNLVDEAQMSSFFTESADDITIGYVDWSVLLNAPDGQLSEDVIAEINFLFQPGVYFGNMGLSNPNALHCFMTSSYDTPQDLNLEEFLCHFPMQTVLQEGEGDGLVASDQWKAYWGDFTIETMPVPVHQFKVEDINQVLEYYMGISLEDFSSESTADLFYFDEAYYNFVSDYGPGVFVCESGVKDGDTVKLTSAAYDEMYGERQPVQVILQEQDGRYLIQSRKTAAAE